MPPRRAAAIRARLLRWWDAGHRALPWRVPPGAGDPYRIWVAEAMLQQTQVAVAAPRYRAFLARFPSLASLARAGEEEVLEAWQGLGYYARARALRLAAGLALERHGGLPSEPEELAALPGVGPYTAGAVASIAFGRPVAAVDGNVARVLARLLLVEGDPAEAGRARRLRDAATALLDRDRPGEWNQALMDLGATVCTPGAPRCGSCPLPPLCAARASGRERDLPAARRRGARRRVELACALISSGGRLLLARRPGRGLLGGLWDLPSVEVVPGEEARAALRRRLAAGLADRGAIEVGREVAAVRRTLTHRELDLRAYRCRGRWRAGGVRPEVRWAGRAALARLAISSATRALLARAGWDQRPRRRRK